MAEVAKPGGDDSGFSEEEVDLLNPQPESSQDKSEKPMPVYIPFRPRGSGRLITSDALTINKLVSSETFREFLAKSPLGMKCALTASLKYQSGVCDYLVSKVVQHRIFAIRSLGLLWFHMSLEDPSAVVLDADVEVVLVKSEVDLAALKPTGRVHRYALLPKSESLMVGDWRIIPLDRGLTAALDRLKYFINGTEKRISDVCKLAPSASAVSDILTPGELEDYQSMPVEDWKSYIRNPRLLPDSAYLEEIVQKYEALQQGILRLSSKGEDVKRFERLVTFGEVSDSPGATVEISLSSGTSPREAEIRKLGKVLPYDNAVVCLRFPDATPVGISRLQRLMKLLISAVYDRFRDSWVSVYHLTHLKYVSEGSAVCVILTFNWEAVVAYNKVPDDKFKVEVLKTLKTMWALPKDTQVLKTRLEVEEPVQNCIAGASPKGLRYSQNVAWTEAWWALNQPFAVPEWTWQEGNSREEVNSEKASEIVKQWFSWLWLAKRRGSRTRLGMTRQIFEQLQGVSTSNEVTLEAFTPVFSLSARASFSNLSSLCESLRNIKET